MKIGGGGLQSLIGQELAPVKKIENVQNKKDEGSVLDPGINKPKVKEEELIKAVEQLNNTVEMLNRDLKFQIHEKTGRIMVQVLEGETGKVINEIPSEEVLDMAAKIRETVGLLVDQYV